MPVDFVAGVGAQLFETLCMDDAMLQTDGEPAILAAASAIRNKRLDQGGQDFRSQRNGAVEVTIRWLSAQVRTFG